MSKVIFFNGPPRSGKDTAAAAVYDSFHLRGIWTVFEKFAMPLKAGFAGVAGATMDVFGNVEPYESTKSEIIPWLGVTYRQFQIDMSEKFMKLQYGDDVFGRLLIERVANKKPSVVTVSDSGFASEVLPVADRFGIENILLIRIHRKGCDFSGDSRSYLSGLVPNELDIENVDIATFREEILEAVETFVK